MGALFQGALLLTALSKATASREEKLDELERRVAAVVLLAYAAAVARLRAAARAYLADRGAALITVNDVTNLLRAAERELGAADGAWLTAALEVGPAFAAAVYTAARFRGAAAPVPDARDAALSAALSEEQAAHLRTFWTAQLEPRLRALLDAAAAAADRTAQEAAVLGALDRLEPGESKVIPGARSHAETYLLGLLAVARTRGGALGNLLGLHAAGVETYALRATVDDRTTAICLYLDGRVFPVAAAVEAADAYARGGPGAEWLSYDDLTALGAGEDRADPAAQTELIAAGVLLPPFHFLCRTVVEPGPVQSV